MQGQDLGEIHPAYIGKKQKYAAGNASPEEKQAAYWNHQHHSALHQQQKGGIGRSRLVCDQVPDPVLLLNGMGKLLEGAATHVIRFDQPHTGDILNHHGIKAYQGAVDIGQDPFILWKMTAITMPGRGSGIRETRARGALTESRYRKITTVL